MTAPRPESGGQQQAAAEVERVARAMFESCYGGTGFDWDDQAEGPDLGKAYYRRLAAAALAEAARPGQELRERLERLAEELDDYAEMNDESVRASRLGSAHGARHTGLRDASRAAANLLRARLGGPAMSGDGREELRERVARAMTEYAVVLVGYKARTPMTAEGLLSLDSARRLADAAIDALYGRWAVAEGETGVPVTPQDGLGAYRANEGEV